MVKLFSAILVMALAASISISTPAQAVDNDLTAADLLKMCTTASLTNTCIAYVWGVRAGIEFNRDINGVTGSANLYCQPVTENDLAVSVAYYIDTTAKLEYSFLKKQNASIMFIAVMRDKFPC